MCELLWGVRERADPIIDNVVPKLGEDPVEHKEEEDPAESRIVPVSGDGRWVVAVVVARADLVVSVSTLMVLRATK